ncbi:MAG: hypothetical protein ABIA04_05920 [Pseudomonadota bacterium]
MFTNKTNKLISGIFILIILSMNLMASTQKNYLVQDSDNFDIEILPISEFRDNDKNIVDIKEEYNEKYGEYLNVLYNDTRRVFYIHDELFYSYDPANEGSACKVCLEYVMLKVCDFFIETLIDYCKKWLFPEKKMECTMRRCEYDYDDNWVCKCLEWNYGE